MNYIDFDLPGQVLKAIGDEILAKGLANAISFFITSDLVSMFSEKIYALVKPEWSAEAIARGLSHRFGKDFIPVKSRKEAETLAAEPLLSVPSEHDLVKMAKGTPFIPYMFSEGVKITAEIKCESNNTKLLVLQRDRFAGILHLEDNVLRFEPTNDLCCEKSIFNRLNNHDRLVSWLWDFLPSDDIIRNIRIMPENFEIRKNDAILFEILNHIGGCFAGDISFLKPSHITSHNFNLVMRLYNRNIKRSMPEYAASDSFPTMLFPGQTNGFPCSIDCKGDLWSGKRELDWYFFPFSSYGKERTLARIQAILLAVNLPALKREASLLG